MTTPTTSGDPEQATWNRRMQIFRLFDLLMAVHFARTPDEQVAAQLAADQIVVELHAADIMAGRPPRRWAITA